MLDHLGPPIESWWADLGTPSISDALKAQIRSGVQEQMSGKTSADIAAERDQLLVQLLAAKGKTRFIP
jgi:hypothetical protein